MATKKISVKKEKVTLGRPKSKLAHQVWFRLATEERDRLVQEADKQGRTFSAHLRWEFFEGRKARGKD